MAKALYVGYFTGAVGNSMGLFCIGDGIIVGIDVGGLKYDGRYEPSSDGSTLEGLVEFTVPPGTPLITGMTPATTPTTIPVQVKLPVDFADGRVVTIQTPTGRVNARFEKIKDLPQ